MCRIAIHFYKAAQYDAQFAVMQRSQVFWCSKVLYSYIKYWKKIVIYLLTLRIVIPSPSLEAIWQNENVPNNYEICFLSYCAALHIHHADSLTSSSQWKLVRTFLSIYILLNTAPQRPQSLTLHLSRTMFSPGWRWTNKLVCFQHLLMDTPPKLPE